MSVSGEQEGVGGRKEHIRGKREKGEKVKI